MSKRICSIHGLWEKTAMQMQCPKCNRVSTRVYDKRCRNKEADRFYHSRQWKRAREQVIARDGGLCRNCKRRGIVKKFDVVDHIKEMKDGGLKLSLDNLECLCHSCHNKKTAVEKSRRGAGKSLQSDEPNTAAPHRFSQKPFLGGTL